jgi:2-acylglycerol O-acyltransferase 2
MSQTGEKSAKIMGENLRERGMEWKERELLFAGMINSLVQQTAKGDDINIFNHCRANKTPLPLSLLFFPPSPFPVCKCEFAGTIAHAATCLTMTQRVRIGGGNHLVGRFAWFVIASLWGGSFVYLLFLVAVLLAGNIRIIAVVLAVSALPYVLPLHRWPAFIRLLQRTADGLASVDAVIEPGALSDDDHGGPPRLFVFGPHGVYSVGLVCVGFSSREVFARRSDVAVVASSFFMLLPPWYCFQRLIGGGRCVGATEQEIQQAMRAKRDIAIVPGGYQEAVATKYGANKTYISKRHGFIRIALQNGPYRVVPCWSFGETRTYWNPQWIMPLRLAIARWSFPMFLPVGSFACPVLPFADAKLLVAMGSPLLLPRIESPSNSDVAMWHSKYCDALRALFDRHKDAAGEPDAVLEIL